MTKESIGGGSMASGIPTPLFGGGGLPKTPAQKKPRKPSKSELRRRNRETMAYHGKHGKLWRGSRIGGSAIGRNESLKRLSNAILGQTDEILDC